MNQRKKRMSKPSNNSLSILFALCLTVFISSGCNQRPDGVLSESEMVEVLTEEHILEGVLRTQNIISQDTTSYYYNSLLEKHQITRAQFDSSLVWYTKHPKVFRNIYISVTKNLSELDQEVKEGKFHPNYLEDLKNTKEELWVKNQQYHFTQDSNRTTLPFEIINSEMIYGDRYVLRFYQQIAPADSSENQHILLKINYEDGKSDSVICSSHHDGLTRRFKIILPAKRKKQIHSLSGSLLGSTQFKGKFNVRIDSISLTRVYNAQIQDSLRALVIPHQQKLMNPIPKVTN